MRKIMRISLIVLCMGAASMAYGQMEEAEKQARLDALKAEQQKALATYEQGKQDLENYLNDKLAEYAQFEDKQQGKNMRMLLFREVNGRKAKLSDEYQREFRQLRRKESRVKRGLPEDQADDTAVEDRNERYWRNMQEIQEIEEFQKRKKQQDAIFTRDKIDVEQRIKNALDAEKNKAPKPTDTSEGGENP